MVRLFVVIVTPFAVVWAFTETLIREGRAAIWHAWNDAAINFGQAKQAWRTKSLNHINQEKHDE